MEGGVPPYAAMLGICKDVSRHVSTNATHTPLPPDRHAPNIEEGESNMACRVFKFVAPDCVIVMARVEGAVFSRARIGRGL